MNNDRWLRELAQVAKDEQQEEQSQLDERWDRLSAGELSPEEEAELQGREAYPAFRPLGPEFQARVVQAVQTQQKKAAPARVLPFYRRWPPLKVWVPAAAAAGIALAVMLRSPAAFPTYTGIQLASGGTRTMRGPSTERSFHPGDALQVSLTPETAVREKIEARCCFFSRGEERAFRLATAAISPQGGVRFDGTLPPDIAKGDWRLWAVVGRIGKIPSDEQLLAELPRTREPLREKDWTALNLPLKIE